jgi:ribosomal protein S18 acetylase RimI-like enzyme
MTVPKITSALGYSQDKLRKAMLDAFSDYAIPMQLSPQQFAEMMRQRGLDLASSRIAISDSQIAGIWLTSVREDRAYLISSGTRPSYRSLGIARALANDSLAYLRSISVCSFQTEVLRNNDTAAALYMSLGMEKQRLLDCYSLPASGCSNSNPFQFEQVPWDRIAPLTRGLFDWEPSWQNDTQSLNAISNQLLCLSLFDGPDVIAFAAVHPGTGTIHQIAVRPKSRRNGIATALIAGIQNQVPGCALRLINICSTDAAFRGLMANLKATETVGQFELKMPM